MTSPATPSIHATTVVCVRHRGRVAVAGDGQVTFGQTIMKAGARKVRKMHHDRVLAGFAGAAADAFTLFARFEAKLEEHRGNLPRAAVELAKEWRMDGLVGIGSGGPYALAAARALRAHSTLEAPQIAEESLRIAAGICVYTNDQITVLSL